MDKVEEFLDLYKTLEEDLKAYYAGRHMKSSSAVFEYMKEEGKKYYDELDVCREVRNLLSHHSGFSGENPIIPGDSLIEALKKIIHEIENPVTALSIATPRNELVTAVAGDGVARLLGKMDEKGISHVPVVNGDRLVGVFSIGAVFEFMRRRPGLVLDEDVKLSHMMDFLPAGAHRTEQYMFCTGKTTLDEVSRMFRCTGPKQRRVAAVFVLKNGDPHSELRGMITPWDVIKAQTEQ